PESQANLKNRRGNGAVSGDAQCGGGGRSPARSRISCNMVDYAAREGPRSVTRTKIRNQLQGIPGVDITIDKSEMGPPTAAPVNIEISGENFDTIRRITREVRQRLVDADRKSVV